MAKGMPWIRAYTSLRTDARSLVLGRLLGDSHAYARILDLRLWLADNAPDGHIAGPHADVVVEEAVGWRGEPGAFARATVSAGFLRAAPARDSSGSGLVDADWADEQAAHLAKVERDRKKPDGRRKSRAAPARDSSGESRELRVESREVTAATQAPAVAAPPPGEDLPDATADAEEVRPPLVLEAQEAPQPARPAPPKAAPPPQPGLVLFEALEGSRKRECERHGLPFVPTRWSFSRQNKELGPVARLPEGHEEQRRLQVAWETFLDDDFARALDVPFSLEFFWKSRSRYEGRGLREVGT